MTIKIGSYLLIIKIRKDERKADRAALPIVIDEDRRKADTKSILEDSGIDFAALKKSAQAMRAQRV